MNSRLILILTLFVISISSCKLTDKEYFQERQKLQLNHFEDAIIWRDHFKPESVLLCGAGMGQRVYAFDVIGVRAAGFDISEYAIKNSPYRHRLGKRLYVGDITNISQNEKYDLVVIYDVFEHLTESQLDAALKGIKGVALKNLVISVPVIGDPNLERDPTHVLKKSRDWWLKKIASFGFKIVETPGNFLYRGQLIIADVVP